MDFSPFLQSKNNGGWLSRMRRKSLLDRGAPRFTKVYLEPTTHCNLQCRGCMRHSWTEAPGEMAPATFQSFLAGIGAVRSLQTVAFWGFGEPLMHPQIVAMVREISRRGLRTEIITNGLLLDRERSEDLVAAGLDTLVVSLDGASPDTQALSRSGADLPAILANLGTLKAAARKRRERELEIGIEFVLTKSNIKEFVGLTDVARQIDAAFVIATNLLPYTEAMAGEILYWMSAQEYTTPRFVDGRPAILFPSVDRRQVGVQLLREQVPGLAKNDSTPWSPAATDGYCPFVERGSVSITWDGRVCPCIALMHNHQYFLMNMPKNVQTYAVGNIGSQSLASIWNDQEFFSFRRRVREFDFAPCARCGGCELAESNQEDCTGSPFPTCGGCLWAKGVLLCP